MLWKGRCRWCLSPTADGRHSAHVPPPATGTLKVGGSADCGESPVQTCLPGLGGVYVFLPSLSPETLAEDKADHVFLMVDMCCAHAGP